MPNASVICEGCWQVLSGACQTCDALGVSVRKIKDDLWGCRTAGDVNTTAIHYRQHVQALDRGDADARLMAIDIKNLATYQRRAFWKPD